MIPFLLLSIIPLHRSIQPVRLRCEYLQNPQGIDALRPRLSWQDTSTSRDQRQTAFEIQVERVKGPFGTPPSINSNKDFVWDTGKVFSDQSTNFFYSGKALTSGQQYSWKVRVWSQDGARSSWSKLSYWSTGLLNATDWKGKWIGLDSGSPPNALANSNWIWFPEGNPLMAAPIGSRFFRRTFTVPSLKISQAIISIDADNQFQLYVNGHPAGKGDDFIVPGIFQIGKFLRPGRNILAVKATNIGSTPNPAGLISNLKISYVRGLKVPISSGHLWKSSDHLQSGWNEPNFNDYNWVPAMVLGKYGMQPWGSVGNENRRLPARYIRREFVVKKKIRVATAYVCGLGFFDMFLNGRKISNDVMDPALSDYFKTDYYVTFDVTNQLKRGKDAIGVILGNGRFYAPRLTDPAVTETFGYPKLLLQLNITYTDGTSEQIESDGSWKVTDQGPIRTNNEYDGEEYDARMEMTNWSKVGFNDAGWSHVQLVSPPGGKLKAQMIEPIRIVCTLNPVNITHPKAGIYIVDMGQNFYGTVQLKAKAARGTRVKMVSAYSLKPNGLLKTADNRSAQSTDIYTFKGRGVETWNPIFKGQGYRRIEVSGFPGVPKPENFEGLMIHSDVNLVGAFQCSSPFVNKLHKTLRRGMELFLRSEPLDPDRDERQAWFGDPAKDAESDAYNFDVAAFYTKWMDDIRTSERPNGSLPDVATFWTWGEDIVWPSVFTIIPDWYIDFYGDSNLSARNYAAMKKWVLAMKSRHQLSDGTMDRGEYGDWCDTSTIGGKVGDRGSTPSELISTAYQFHNYQIMNRVALLLGHGDDAKTFDNLANQMKIDFNRKFFDPQTDSYSGKTQCGYVLALQFGLAPIDHRAAIIQNLVRDIMVTHHGHLTVGLIGMQWLMQTLTEIGRPDVAWTIVNQKTRPSWGYMLSKGATTIWERWDFDTRDPGMNSEALLIQAGNLDAWFYQTVAGITCDPAGPGFKKIFIRPEPLSGLTWASGQFNSVHGVIHSSWRHTKKEFDLTVSIPANTTATVFIPASGLRNIKEGGKSLQNLSTLKTPTIAFGKAVIEIGSGTYHFRSQM